MRQVVLTADDFGLSVGVNEGVERAFRDGVLTSASLMVGGAAVEDAVARARRLPGLRVGLHLVVIEGPAVLPASVIPGLVGAGGQFPGDQLRLGVRYFFDPRVRRQLAAEIRAQFVAFAETGLVLDHANAHKHMHLHPTIGGLLVSIGAEFGLPRVRVPCEPGHVMARCGERPGFGAWAMQAWTRVLRGQVRRAGMDPGGPVFGLAWSGHMTEARLLRLIPELPDGHSEIYFHPAVGRDEVIDAVMPDYEHAAELAALVSPAVRAALAGR